MYQKHVIVGRLGADPEMRYTPAGAAYTKFSVAVDRKWNDAQGQAQQETVWYRITAWSKLAEICHQYLNKGRLVLVEGDRLYVSPYTNKDNQPAASLELTARTVQFLSSPKDANGNGAAMGETVAEAEEDAVPF